MQQSKQKSLYDFVENDEQVFLLNARTKSPLVKQSDKENVLKAVTMWRAMLGVGKNVEPEELALATNFIHANFGDLSLDEIILAINLSIMEKLHDCKFSGLFAPIYISRVLNAYLHYRKINLAEPTRKYQKYLLELDEQSKKPSPEQQVNMMKEIFQGHYEDIKTKEMVNDPFVIAFNFLWKHKNIFDFKISKEDTEEALQFADRQYDSDLQKEYFSLFSKINENDRKLCQSRYSKNYIVAKYLKNVDIELLFNKIKPELFS